MTEIFAVANIKPQNPPSCLIGQKIAPHSPPLPTLLIPHLASPSPQRHSTLPSLFFPLLDLAAPYQIALPATLPPLFLSSFGASPVSHRNLHPYAPTLPSSWPHPRATFPMIPSLHHHPRGPVPVVTSLTTIPKPVSHPYTSILSPCCHTCTSILSLHLSP